MRYGWLNEWALVLHGTETLPAYRRKTNPMPMKNTRKNKKSVSYFTISQQLYGISFRTYNYTWKGLCNDQPLISFLNVNKHSHFNILFSFTHPHTHPPTHPQPKHLRYPNKTLYSFQKLIIKKHKNLSVSPDPGLTLNIELRILIWMVLILLHRFNIL